MPVCLALGVVAWLAAAGLALAAPPARDARNAAPAAAWTTLAAGLGLGLALRGSRHRTHRKLPRPGRNRGRTP